MNRYTAVIVAAYTLFTAIGAGHSEIGELVILAWLWGWIAPAPEPAAAAASGPPPSFPFVFDSSFSTVFN